MQLIQASSATIAGPIAPRGLAIVPEGATRSIELRVCVIAHIHDGKMARAREYFDSGSIARQLGLDSATVAAMYSSLGAEAKLTVGVSAASAPATVTRSVR